MTDKAEPVLSCSPVPFWKKGPFHLALIVLVGLVAYSNTFSVPFVYDDFASLLELPYVQDLGYLTDWSVAREHASEHSFRVRYIAYLSFGLNYAMHGPTVGGYHVVNLLIHLASALLVYLLVRLTPSGEGSREELAWRTPYIALFAALLFVAHPVQTQAVTYIVQRLASLATLFCLGAIVCYVKARRELDAGEEGKGGLPWYAGSLICAVLAMKTKEIAFTVPLAICIYEWLFFRATWRRRAPYLAPLLLTMLIIPLSLLLVPEHPAHGVARVVEATRVDSDLSRHDYFVTQLRVIVTYIRLLFLPLNQNLIYEYREFHSLFVPQVLFSLFFLLSIFGTALRLAWRHALPQVGADEGGEGRPHRFEKRLIAFGILWFFITLSVESSFIPITDVIFEHRLYLPSMGAVVAFAAFFAMASDRLQAVRKDGAKLAVSLAGVIVLMLAVTALARNHVWRSQESLWQDVVNKSPGKAAGHQNLGIALFQKGEMERAFASFDKAIAIDPEFAEALCNRGNLYAQAGQPDKALLDYQRAVEAYPEFVEAWNNIGLVHSNLGQQEKAIGYLAKAMELKPTYVKALNNMGLALIRKGEPARAVGYLNRALYLNSKYDLAYFNRGVAFTQLGRLEQAVADLSRSVQLNPRQAAAYTYRGEALARAGAREGAIADFRAACQSGDQNGCRKYQELTGQVLY